jgi:hypothetical protein
VVSGDFYVEFHLKNKNDGFEWAVVAVYGAAEDVNKAAYLSELVRICESESIPMLFGGDFNIMTR